MKTGYESNKSDSRLLEYRKILFIFQNILKTIHQENKNLFQASTSTLTFSGKKHKRTRVSTGATPASQNSSAPPAKKELTAGHAGNTGGGGKPRIPPFTKDEMEITLQGVQPTL